MAEQICNYLNIFNSVGRSYNANALTFNWKPFTMLKTCANYSETVELWVVALCSSVDWIKNMISRMIKNMISRGF